MYNWLFLLILYLPFQIALNPAPNFDLASLRVLVVLLSLFWFVKNSKKFFKIIYDGVRLKNIQTIGLVLFFVATLLSLIGAENIFWGLRKIMFFMSIFPLYFLTIALVDNLKKVKKITWVLFGGGAVFALVGLFQFLSVFIFGLERVYNFWAWNIVPVFSGFNFGAMLLTYSSWLVNVDGQTIMRAFSFFSDPHMFSFYMGMVLPLGAVLLVRGNISIPRSYSAKGLYVSFFLIFAALLLSFARGAYLAIIAAFLLIAVFLWFFARNKKVAVALCLILLIFIIPGTPISDRFYSSFDLDEGSNAGRLEMWQRSGQTGLGHFWNGVGLGNYAFAVDSGFGYRNPVTAHNLYLDIFSEIGFLGLLCWLFLLLGTIWQLFQKLKKTKQTKEKYIIIGLLGSLIYFLVHSFFETPIYNPSVLALLMVILGISSAIARTSRGDTNT